MFVQIWDVSDFRIPKNSLSTILAKELYFKIKKNCTSIYLQTFPTGFPDTDMLLMRGKIKMGPGASCISISGHSPYTAQQKGRGSNSPHLFCLFFPWFPFFYAQHNIIWPYLQWCYTMNSSAIQPSSQQWVPRQRNHSYFCWSNIYCQRYLL